MDRQRMEKWSPTVSLQMTQKLYMYKIIKGQHIFHLLFTHKYIFVGISQKTERQTDRQTELFKKDYFYLAMYGSIASKQKVNTTNFM